MTMQILQVEMHAICGGQLAVNVLHFRGDTAETDLFQLARDAVDEIIGNPGGATFNATSWMEAMADTCFLSLVSARVVGTGTSPVFPRVIPATDFPGQQSGSMYSQSVACNIKLITASGPDLTGRIFYPGVPEAALVRNRWTTAYEAIILTLRDAFLAGFEVGGVDFTPVVFSHTVNGAETVTNTMLVPNPATQRRRLTPY